ncbi:NEL domain-containing protein [Pseudomonas monteilii]|uniref:NEL domain-containing protein n=1 Tax=Pseudomonas monteilii TaxID=76759 RepID=UPI001CC122DC|nr:NEL domain-containing protein [Pseudomonas monteilii]
MLTNQNLPFSENELNLLAGLRQLRYLDLSGNRLAPNNSPSFHELSLDFLGLDHMQLAQWPIGIGSDALGRIARLSMRNNNLRSLPSFLLNEADALPNPTVIALEGNPVNETHLQRLLLNERAETAGITVDVPAELTGRLARIRDERQQMRDAIEGWAQASSSSNPLTQAALADRQRIQAAISQFWEQQEQGQRYLRLQLEDVAVDQFPRRLPAFFDERVQALVLTRTIGTASQLEDLLSRFPNVTRLTIDAHQAATSSLASALARLPQLNYLEFRNMGLAVDQAMLEVFAGLEHLTSLDLSGNHVGTISQVPARLSSNLQSLALTNMNLQAWPSWCDSLLPLELLDLSNNRITQLPEHILSNLNNPMPISSISLFDNPLPLETIMRVRAFSDSQHSFSFALDIPDNLLLVNSSSEGSLDHPHFPLMSDDTPRLEDWMLGNEAQNEALRDCWEMLEGSDLLRLAGRLRNAAPYMDPTSQASFCERVRMVLVVAASNEAERPLMESIAAAALPHPETGSQTCHDGALQEFNNIELYLMGQRLMIEAGDTLQTLRRRLLQLFRVEQLELLAQQRSGSGDRVSVRLAYRRELARELDLPLADSMRFRSAANLAPDELSQVLEKVRKSELGDPLVDYMLANTDWVARLRAEHADRFAQVEARFRQHVLELASKDHSLEEELSLQQRLQNDKNLEEQELLRELTIAQINS